MTLPQRLESVFKRLAEVEKEKWEFVNEVALGGDTDHGPELILNPLSEKARTYYPEYLSSDDCDEIAGEMKTWVEVRRRGGKKVGYYAVVWIDPDNWNDNVLDLNAETPREARIEGLIKAVELYVEGKK